MKFEELKKKATPGPWRHVLEDAPEIVGPKHNAETFHYQYIATMSCGLSDDGSQCKANTALVVHCVNNFGRALEAMRLLRNLMHSLGAGRLDDRARGELDAMYDILEPTINKLEEVE